MAQPRKEKGFERRKWTDSVLSYRFVLWWSIAWGIVVMAISPIVNYITPFLNPSYANQWTPDIYWRLVLYWHGGIFIPWITALAVLATMLFKLDKVGGISSKLIRDSVFVGGFIAVPVAGIAGIFDVYDNFALGVPLWTQIFAFLIGDEMAIALIIAMVNQPRQSGHGYLRAGLPYYTTLVTVCSALIAALMGHIAGYISWFGPNPAPVSQYVSGQMTPALGFYNSTAVIAFTEDVVGSHSHLMLPALMAGVIGLVAAFFGYYDKWSRSERMISRFGFLVMLFGLATSIWVYVVSGVGNYAIPALFTSGPGGVNGVAEDDIITGIIGLGGFFVLVALLMNSRRAMSSEGIKLRRDPLFLSLIASWIVIYLVIPVTGYLIEFNESFYHAGGLAFDQAFTRFHQDFAFYLLPPLVTVILGFSAFGIVGKFRRYVGYLFLSGVTLAFVFGQIYTMFALSSVSLYLAAFGGALIALGGVLGVLYLARSPLVVSADEKRKPPIIQIDCREMKLSESLRAISRAYDNAKGGELIELLTTDPATQAAIIAWSDKTDNRATQNEEKGVFVIQVKITGKDKVPPPRTK